MILQTLLRELRGQGELPEWRPRGTPLAALQGAAVHFGDTEILHDVSLVAHAGEVVALVGPNGAGKSTTLAALAGDVGLDHGEVHLDGTPLHELTELDIARRRAVLPQRSTVSFPFSVRQVVQMGRAPWLHTDQEDDDEAIVARCLRDSGVEDLRDRPMSELSGGEAARVAFARTLAQQTQLILLDEPTAALDIHHQELCLSLMRARVAEGAGAVVVLHDLGAAAAHADRIVVIAEGRVAADGPPDAVLTPELLGDVYHHPVDVIPHPVTGSLLVLPRRA